MSSFSIFFLPLNNTTTTTIFGTAIILPPVLTFQFLHSLSLSAHNELVAYLFDFFKRYLSDSSHRETYESAHSVILSIFALHAQRQQQQHTGKTKTTNNNFLSGVVTNAGGRGEDNKHKHGLEDGKVFTPISNPLGEAEEEESVDLLANFVERMVPFYAQCLIEVGWWCFLCFLLLSLFIIFTEFRERETEHFSTLSCIFHVGSQCHNDIYCYCF